MGGIDDLSGQKGISPVQVGLTLLDSSGIPWQGPGFPMDSEAGYVYFSRLGGIAPVSVAGSSIFDNPAHYGAGFFEGVRLYLTLFGPSFIELSSNIARLIFSSLAFNPALILATQEIMKDPNVVQVEHVQRTPREFFADVSHALQNGGGINLALSVISKDGSRREVKVPVRFNVMFPEGVRELKMNEFEAAMCSLAFLNRLVRTDRFPNGVELIQAGYFRPFGWSSGKHGLKIPSLILNHGSFTEKPFYFAIGTLPWGKYLPEKGYQQGLDVVVAPLPRIDESMPVTQKVAGCYVNSAMNINTALVAGFGEILTLNHLNQIVEGSAENLIFLFTNKKTGEMVAKCPPLSSNILAGTNRDRYTRILDEGITLNGKKIRHELEAPSLNYVLACLKGNTDWELSSLAMVGTGVNIIHVRSITTNPALRDWLGLGELRSEETAPDPIILCRAEETSRRFEINNCQQHPFIAALRDAYRNLVLGENGARLTPAYSMDFEVAARMFGVDLKDAASPGFIAAAGAGRYNDRVNGLIQPDECRARYQEVASVMKKMVDLRMANHRQAARQKTPTF